MKNLYFILLFLVLNGCQKSEDGKVEVAIKTINVPALTTNEVTEISSSGANSGGTVTSDGGATITSLGIVWDTATNPTIALSTKASSTTSPSLGAFKSSMTGLKESTKYYVRAYATNSAGTSYGNELSFTTNAAVVLPVVSTYEVTEISSSGGVAGGTSGFTGNYPTTARGVVWDISTNPSISLSTKTNEGGAPTAGGAFKTIIKDLKPSTKYFVRAYATTGLGTGYGNEVSFTTPAVGFVFGTVTSPTGKIWMDRNLGASRVATSSTDNEAYGDYYQWGRGADGHQKRTSATTDVKSTTNVPLNNSSFILVSSFPEDWQAPASVRWQGVNGANNPCPSGFRLPTIKEWEAEVLTWSEQNSSGAFKSILKLPRGGHRLRNSGLFMFLGTGGFYWSSTVYDSFDIRSAYQLSLVGNANVNSYETRAYGNCVRCIKD